MSRRTRRDSGGRARRRKKASGGARSGTRRIALADVCAAMESIAPTGLAQDWDNVGLLAGDPAARVSRALACIDLTPDVVGEALREKADLVLAYHPVIFKPLTSLRADSTAVDAVVFRCIRNGLAVYAVHTALDAADGGTNDVIASLCGLTETEPLECVDKPSRAEYKLVVFVPPGDLERTAAAMFSAGAGHIGDYTQCSYRTAGQGTFFGGKSTSPALGERGRMEYVDEIRLETVVPSQVLPDVVTALVKVHPYEEPAFDIYPLKAPPVGGIGRVGALPRGMTLGRLARKLKRTVQAHSVPIVGPSGSALSRSERGGRGLRNTHGAAVQIVGAPDRPVSRAIIVVGAAGSLPFRRVRCSVPGEPGDSGCDVIVTGEIRHHDALTIQRLGCTAIALGHWASERPVLASLVTRLEELVPGLAVTVSTADRDPFQAV